MKNRYLSIFGGLALLTAFTAFNGLAADQSDNLLLEMLNRGHHGGSNTGTNGGGQASDAYHNGSFCSAQSVNIVENGSFEADQLSRGWDILTSSQLTGWNVDWRKKNACKYARGTSVDEPVLELQKNLLTQAPDGDQYAELDSDCQGPDAAANTGPAPKRPWWHKYCWWIPRHKERTSTSIWQELETTPGETYTLSFRYRARQNVRTRQKLRVEFGDEVVVRRERAPEDWTLYSYTVKADSDTTILRFTDVGTADSLGVFLDDVKVLSKMPCESCDCKSFEATKATSHAFWLPGISKNLVFVEGGGNFIEKADGTAHVNGVLQVDGDDTKQFYANVTFSGRTRTAPDGSPKSVKGTPDMNAWRYYTTVEGTLTGVKEFSGATIKVSRFGPAVQVGDGANDKNEAFGLSAWLTVEIVSQPTNAPAFTVEGSHGDINLNLGALRMCKYYSAKESFHDELSNRDDGHAYWFYLLLDDYHNFVLEDGAAYVEYDDNTARLTGITHADSDATKRFIVDNYFTDKVEVGEPVPAKNPYLRLRSSSYFPEGPIDPTTWYYYETFSGTMTGVEGFDGALLTMMRRSHAFQVGYGANGKNGNLGVSGLFNYHTITQPNDPSMVFPPYKSGELVLDITCVPGEVVDDSVPDTDTGSGGCRHQHRHGHGHRHHGKGKGKGHYKYHKQHKHHGSHKHHN